MRQAQLYLITNSVNAKVYVGYTEQTLEARWKQHVYAAEKRSDRHHTKLYRAIRKYGIDKFHIRGLLRSPHPGLVLAMEATFVRLLDSFKNGYNTTPGGQNFKCPSPETEALRRQRLSENNCWRGKSRSGELAPMYGKHLSDTAKQKISEKAKERFRNGTQVPFFKGKQMPEEIRKKMSEGVQKSFENGRVGSRTGSTWSEETSRKWHEANDGKVTWTKNWIVTHPDGTEEKTDNMAEFCRAHDLNRGNMSSVASGRLNHYKGWRVRLADDVHNCKY